MKNLDFDSLTLGEIATIEDLAGYGIGALNEEKPQGRFLAALYMVARRRDGDPAYSFNRAMATPISEAQKYLGVETGSETEPDTDAGEPDDGEPDDGGASAEGNAPSYETPVTE